jgi:sugar phosphate permease
MRLIVATVVPILLLAMVLLAYGILMTTRGIRGDYESPRLYLIIGLTSTTTGAVLAALTATILLAVRRRATR